jgi:uncharacterized protein YecT (DUF1311 family)
MTKQCIYRAALLLSLTGAAGMAAAASTDCSNATTTGAMEQCAATEQKAVEAKLNTTYQRTLKAFDGQEDAKAKQMLVEAQRAWIKFREADCKAVYQKWGDGTIRGLMYIGCMQQRAEQRIKELDDFASRQ